MRYAGYKKPAISGKGAENGKRTCSVLRGPTPAHPDPGPPGVYGPGPASPPPEAPSAGAELLLSIHLNYDSSASSSGFECYAAPPRLSTNAESVRFGQLLAAAFSDLGLRLRGANGVRYLYYDENDNKLIYESTDSTVLWDPTFTVLEACGCPAVLCEEGFISNAGDMALLSGDGCDTAAKIYYDCICSYFNLT